MTVTGPRPSFISSLPLLRPSHPRLAVPRWIATAPPDLTDAEAATFGRTHPLREAQTLLAFHRAGGGAILHR